MLDINQPIMWEGIQSPHRTSELEKHFSSFRDFKRMGYLWLVSVFQYVHLKHTLELKHSGAKNKHTNKQTNSVDALLM